MTFFQGSALRLVLCTLLLGFPAQASDAIREFNLQIRSLAVDARTGLLYGGQTNRLVQIDPASGQVLRSFDFPASIEKIERGAGSSLWLAQDFAVRRFDLDTLAADEPIDYPGELLDLAASPSDPFLAAVSTPTINGRWATAWVVRNGALLPDSVLLEAIGLNSAFLFGHVPRGGPLRYTLGPSGIIASSHAGLPLSYSGRFVPLKTHVYHSSGVGFPANLTQPAVEVQNRYWFGGDPLLAVHAASDSVFYLSQHADSWDLNRYEHPTLRHTGHYRLPKLQPAFSPGNAMVAWSNFVAFNTDQKLLILDVDRLLLPGDLEVVQTVSPSVPEFGNIINFDVTVTNHGPGAAIDVSITNSLDSSVATLSLLPAHTQHTLRISALAAAAGQVFTNTAQVTAANDPNPANNAATRGTLVTPPSGRVATLSLAPSDIAYWRAAGDVLLTTGQSIHRLDPVASSLTELAVSPPWFPLARLEGGQSPNDIFAQGASQLRNIARFFVSGGNAPFAGNLGFTVIDFSPSPADPDLLVISDDTGTFLARPGVTLPQRIDALGEVEFSENGTQVYFLNVNSCELEIYNVTSEGLVLARPGTPVPCSGMTARGGLIYFNTGLIFDPAAGAASPGSRALPMPSFVAPRANGFVDVLTRVGGSWELRRYQPGSLTPQFTIPLLQISAIPFEMIEAGPEHVAIRSGSLLLVRMVDEASVTLQAVGGTPPALAFLSTLGKTYRIEETQNLDGPWTTRRDLPGTGQLISEPIPASDAMRFFRVLTLP